MVDHLFRLGSTRDRISVVAVRRVIFYEAGSSKHATLNKPLTLRGTSSHNGEATFLLPGQLLHGDDHA